MAQSGYVYDPAGRLTDLTYAQEATVLADYEWVYDAANRITQFTSLDGVSEYSYDERDQLTGADHSYQGDEAYSYDDNGNRTNEGYETGTNNQLLSNGIYTYEYDAEGNRTKQTEIATGEVVEYSWDHRNRLTAVVTKDSSGAIIESVEYTYDAFDRRIEKSVDADGDGPEQAEVERYVYDGDHIALVFDGQGNQTHRYLHGPQIDQVLAEETADGRVQWALVDNQGTIRDVIDSDGIILNHISYDSFGNITGETNPEVDFRFGYTGREFDEETGQYYYRARYYGPSLGQFINEDLIGFEGGDANLYRYVYNNPMNLTDPSGLLVEGTFDIGTGVLILTDLDSGRTITVENIFSGNSEKDPIPVGTYDILDHEYDTWYRLDARDLNPRDDYFFFRSGFRLHPGSISEGCITVPRNDPGDWQSIEYILENTATQTVNDRAGRLSWFRTLTNTAPTRIYYGTLTVTDSSNPVNPTRIYNPEAGEPPFIPGVYP